MHQTAKIFVTGRSQAVRLPLEFRFDVAEVFIRHEPATGDVVLSRKPTNRRAAVSQLIEQEFGIKLQARSVGKYLARWGFTPPRVRLDVASS